MFIDQVLTLNRSNYVYIYVDRIIVSMEYASVIVLVMTLFTVFPGWNSSVTGYSMVTLSRFGCQGSTSRSLSWRVSHVMCQMHNSLILNQI